MHPVGPRMTGGLWSPCSGQHHDGHASWWALDGSGMHASINKVIADVTVAGGGHGFRPRSRAMIHVKAGRHLGPCESPAWTCCSWKTILTERTFELWGRRWRHLVFMSGTHWIVDVPSNLIYTIYLMLILIYYKFPIKCVLSSIATHEWKFVFMILCFLSMYELKHCDRNKILRSTEKHDIIINLWASHKMLEHITWSLNFRTTNNSVIDPKPRCNTHVFLLVLIKNKLQNPSVNREMNLLSLINSSLAHVLL
jgi:hypothetical protein